MSREYRSWASLIAKTENPNTEGFRYYGQKGIRMSPEWRNSFETFFADIGPIPEGRFRLERLDKAGDFMPGNAEWTERKPRMRQTQSVFARADKEAKRREKAEQKLIKRRERAAARRKEETK